MVFHKTSNGAIHALALEATAEWIKNYRSVKTVVCPRSTLVYTRYNVVTIWRQGSVKFLHIRTNCNDSDVFGLCLGVA